MSDLNFSLNYPTLLKFLHFLTAVKFCIATYDYHKVEMPRREYSGKLMFLSFWGGVNKPSNFQKLQELFNVTYSSFVNLEFLII